jgi:small subunit ribosomal protein S19e
MTIYDIDPNELIEELAKELAKVESIKAPEWASFVKTGVHKERPPAREDWWVVRVAAVLRKVRLKGPIGVSKLRTLYGGRKNRGHQPEIFKKGSGNILRKVLQQLEKAELVKQGAKGVHKGRIITPKGIKIMDGVAKKIGENKPAEKPKVEVKPKVVKAEKPKAEKAKVEVKADKPKVEAPKAEAPKAEVKTEAPKVEKPKVEAKPEVVKAETPKEAPKVETKPEVKAEAPKSE